MPPEGNADLMAALATVENLVTAPAALGKNGVKLSTTENFVGTKNWVAIILLLPPLDRRRQLHAGI
jgi:hypothetical protein